MWTPFLITYKSTHCDIESDVLLKTYRIAWRCNYGYSRDFTGDTMIEDEWIPLKKMSIK